MQAEPRTEAERTEASTSSSLLDRLRAPQPSDLARSRQLKRNPPVGKSGTNLRRHHMIRSLSPHQRLREFANENLTVSAGKLFCTGCREELGLKVIVIKQHLKSKKRQLGKE